MKNEQETLALISNAEIHKWPIKTPHSLIPLRQYFEMQTDFLYIQLRFFCFVSNIYKNPRRRSCIPPKGKPLRQSHWKLSHRWNSSSREKRCEKEVVSFSQREYSERLIQFYQIDFHVWFNGRPKSLQNKFLKKEKWVRHSKSQKFGRFEWKLDTELYNFCFFVIVSILANFEQLE